MNLKEYLSSKSDVREQEITIPEFDVTVRIRRITVGERKHLYHTYKIDTPQADVQGLTAEIIALSVVPPMTVEEVEQLPAVLSDTLIQRINEFNGWSKKGAAELADQFRPTA
jgi:hypothetical protein